MESRWGRGWLVATPGDWKGVWNCEKWTEKQLKEIIRTEEGQNASPRAELENVLTAAWEIHQLTGASKICVVNDCDPAVRALNKAYSPTQGMQDILDRWLPKLAQSGVMVVGVREDRERLTPVDVLARGQVHQAHELLRERGWLRGSRDTQE